MFLRKKDYLRRHIENSSRKEFEDFPFFFLTMSRVYEKRVGENGRKRHVKISKVEFRFFFPPIF